MPLQPHRFWYAKCTKCKVNYETSVLVSQFKTEEQLRNAEKSLPAIIPASSVPNSNSCIRCGTPIKEFSSGTKPKGPILKAGENKKPSASSAGADPKPIKTEDESPKTIHQIITQDGEAAIATSTSNAWVGYNNEQFALPKGGNDVMPFTTSKNYFEEFIKETEGAQSEIYIIGWQVNWDALLAPGKRLFDVLLAAAKRGVKIYVMPWNDSPPVQTYDDQTKSVLEGINSIVGKDLVQVRLADAHADRIEAFFSHHQKQVVIDRKVAFVGGIDLAYGRYDDSHFNLQASSEGRYALNRYNGCIAWTGKVSSNLVDPDKMKGALDSYARNPFSSKSKTNADLVLEKIVAGAWQAPYQEQGAGSVSLGAAFGFIANAETYGTVEKSAASPRAESNSVLVSNSTLDSDTQPRMPWQDVHCKIVGPAVDDLIANFVMRWNITGPASKLPIPDVKPYTMSGKCLVQVLRSAPLALRQLERDALTHSSTSSSKALKHAQNDIHRAMLNLINKANHFIYIENQFFVSDFGKLDGYDNAGPKPIQDPSADEKGPPASRIMSKHLSGPARWGTRTKGAWGSNDQRNLPQNEIVRTLAKKINDVIFNKKPKPFHIYITLPVHSEGLLNVGAIVAQVHWTMQSLVFGTNSLLNCIRRSLHAKSLWKPDQAVPTWAAIYASKDNGYKDIDIEQCFQYVTLLNLRNWAKLGDRYVTEQVYVHSKLLIVDDLYAILGSANINDRSLLGSRDSELAVMVLDSAQQSSDPRKSGQTTPTRQFARDLRMGVWNKIFGITAGGEKAANELKNAVLHPASPDSWRAIQLRAKQNRDRYEAAFDFIPRNTSTFVDSENRMKKFPSSIWPRWNPQKIGPTQGDMEGHMPFEQEFWSKPQHSAAASNLTGVKGFITLLPVEWTSGENNRIPYHNDLLTHNQHPDSMREGQPQLAQATPVKYVETEEGSHV